MKQWTIKNKVKVIRLDNLRCNCYLICNGTSCFLVDTSVRAERKTIERQLKKIGIHSLNGIIITHVHLDHVGNVAYFQHKYQCKVYVHPGEVNYLRKGYSPIPEGTNQMGKIVHRLSNLIPRFLMFEPCNNLVSLTPDAKMEGLKEIVILNTPGHTKGSISVIVDHKIAIVGDAMFHMKKHEIYPPFANEETKIIGSWEALLKTEAKLFLPAHGKEITKQLLWNILCKK